MSSPFAVRVAELRKSAGMTQVELARRARLSQVTISEIENGTIPRDQTFARLCGGLGLDEGAQLELMRLRLQPETNIAAPTSDAANTDASDDGASE